MSSTGMQRRFAIAIASGEIGASLDEPACELVRAFAEGQRGLLEPAAACVDIAVVENGLERLEVARGEELLKVFGQCLPFCFRHSSLLPERISAFKMPAM